MLRTSVKEEWLCLIETMEYLQRKGLVGNANEAAFHVLQDCQEAAIALGENVEKYASTEKKIVTMLEEYCEELFQVANQLPVTEETVHSLDKLLLQVKEAVTELPSKCQVVFFPYKASMWDSLESIWLAAQEDFRCECFVVPIPYYRYDNENKKAVYCYEGSDFPDYVTVTDYRQYVLEIQRPDIAYVHNPYDDHNLVTSVASDYYSFNLKKNVGKLVYVPYYVSAGGVSDRQKNVSVYYHMDYMIAQSKRVKEGFVGLPYEDKLLPMGSPKFDRIIRKCKEGVQTSQEWKRIIGRKKSLMLNTSINCFLSQGEFFIGKLREIFDYIRRREGVVLIWRPHPLIKATIDAMRPELRQKYEELVTYFVSDEVGILDTTPDVTDTIAIVDGYIGEASSSVAYLFEAAGKPIFILNNFINNAYSYEEKRRVIIGDMVEKDGIWWVTPFQYDGLFCMQPWQWEKMQFVARTNQDTSWSGTCLDLECVGEDIYLAPYDSMTFNKYDLHTKKMVQIGEKQERDITARKVISYGNKIFYLLNYEDAILKYDIVSEEWKRFEGMFAQMQDGVEKATYSNMWDCIVSEKYIVITACYTNRILIFDMQVESCQIVEIGEKASKYSGVSCEQDVLYLAETQSGAIVKINVSTGESNVFSMPESFIVRKPIEREALAHSKILNVGEWIITLPCNGNCMVKMNKNTGESHLVIPEFWEETQKVVNGYHPSYMNTAFFIKNIDDKCLVTQRICDGAVAVLNIETEEYEVCYPVMDEESFAQFMEGQDGFEQHNMDNNFACWENRFFSVEQFVEALEKGNLEEVKKRQFHKLEGMAENLDGTCGEKVHEYMMKVLGEHNV